MVTSLDYEMELLLRFELRNPVYETGVFPIKTIEANGARNRDRTDVNYSPPGWKPGALPLSYARIKLFPAGCITFQIN